LRGGASAKDTLDALTAADELREQRQAGVVAASGRGATYTGSECFSWAGGAVGDGYAIQGNILTGPKVVAAMEEAYPDTGRAPPPACPSGRRWPTRCARGSPRGATAATATWRPRSRSPTGLRSRTSRSAWWPAGSTPSSSPSSGGPWPTAADEPRRYCPRGR